MVGSTQHWGGPDLARTGRWGRLWILSPSVGSLCCHSLHSSGAIFNSGPPFPHLLFPRLQHGAMNTSTQNSYSTGCEGGHDSSLNLGPLHDLFSLLVRPCFLFFACLERTHLLVLIERLDVSSMRSHLPCAAKVPCNGIHCAKSIAMAHSVFITSYRTVTPWELTSI